MQQCFMFIDTGNGWTPVNDSATSDSFTGSERGARWT